jgi:hypothetical protein
LALEHAAPAATANPARSSLPTRVSPSMPSKAKVAGVRQTLGGGGKNRRALRRQAGFQFVRSARPRERRSSCAAASSAATQNQRSPRRSRFRNAARAHARHRRSGLQLDTLVNHQRPGPLGTAQLVRGERHGMHAGGIQRAEIQASCARRPVPHRYGTMPAPTPHCAASPATSCTAPVSLLASITDTSAACRPSPPESRRRRHGNPSSTAISRSRQPERRKALAGSRTQGCSIAEIATVPGDMQAAAPLMNRLLASEPAAGEHHLGGMGADGVGHALPRLVDRPPRRTPILVAAGCVAEASHPGRAAWPHAPSHRAAWSRCDRNRRGRTWRFSFGVQAAASSSAGRRARAQRTLVVQYRRLAGTLALLGHQARPG